MSAEFWQLKPERSNHYKPLNDNNNMNTFWKIIIHAVVIGAVFGLSSLLTLHPAFLDWTIGSIVSGILVKLMNTQNSTVAFHKN